MLNILKMLQISKAPDGQGLLLTNYKPKLWEEAVGEGVEPSRSGYSHCWKFPMLFATATRRCVCLKFHHPTVFNFLSLEFRIWSQIRIWTLDQNFQLRKLLGKGSNLHGVVSAPGAHFPNSPPPGQGGVSAWNFTTQQVLFKERPAFTVWMIQI